MIVQNPMFSTESTAMSGKYKSTVNVDAASPRERNGHTAVVM